MLYRYLNAEGLEATIQTQALRLAKISSLNDPFDFNPNIKLKEVGDGELREIYQQYSKLDITRMSNSDLRKDRSLREANFSPSMRDILSKNLGIISFSKLHDNPLLWAHYADKHLGANIGFHIEHPPFSDMKTRDILVDVVYQKDRPTFHHHPLDNEAFLKEIESVMRIKSEVWSYEEEVRAILPTKDLKGIESRIFEEDGYCHLRIRPNEWKEIRFGIYTEQFLIKKVMNLAKEKNMTDCNFYKALLHKDKFLIEFESLS